VAPHQNGYGQQAPPPVPKHGWRPQHQQGQHEEEALPNDSLYGNGVTEPRPTSAQWREQQQQKHYQQQQQQAPTYHQQQQQQRPGLRGNLEHWSSHGYLANPPTTRPRPVAEQPTISPNGGANDSSGYVLLKKQGDQMVTFRAPPGQQQPQSLPTVNGRSMTYQQQNQQYPAQPEQDRKYFSVRNFHDMKNKHNNQESTNQTDMSKYYSVDARYNSVKHNLPPDLKLKLQQLQQQQQPQSAPYIPPHNIGSHGHNAPAPPPKPNAKEQPSKSSLEKSKHISGSVSWLEWTQQLQAYVAWVNSQLRKRPDLKQVQDLRTDLQSGEVLAQLIEIICKCSTKEVYPKQHSTEVFLPSIEI
jgi:hypothetical protein